jgi:hypothetical protein
MDSYGGYAMNTVPQELNWVEIRATCSAPQVFKELQTGIEGDVIAANKADTMPGPFVTTLTRGGHAIIVSVENEVGPRIVFYCTNGLIVATDEKRNLKVVVAPALNDAGRRVLKLEDGTELEQWQFRKKTLEGFFFGD